MAIGTVTQVGIDPHSQQGSPVSIGDLKMTVTNVVGDSSYVTGGSPLSAAQLGLTRVLAAQTSIVATTGTNSAASASVYNTGSGTLQCFNNITATTGTSAPATECAAAANLSGITWQIIAFGY